MAKLQMDLFYDNTQRSKKLSIEYYEYYDKLVRHILNQKTEFLKADILLCHILNEFEEAQGKQRKADTVVGKNFKDYIKKIEKTIDFKEEMKVYRQRDYEKYTFSGIWLTICAYLVLLFVKEIVSDHYLINFSIDLIVAAVALYLAASNLFQFSKIIKRLALDKRPLVIEYAGLVCGLVLAIVTAQSPFDVTFLILVAAYWFSKRDVKKQIEAMM